MRGVRCEASTSLLFPTLHVVVVLKHHHAKKGNDIQAVPVII